MRVEDRECEELNPARVNPYESMWDMNSFPINELLGRLLPNGGSDVVKQNTSPKPVGGTHKATERKDGSRSMFGGVITARAKKARWWKRWQSLDPTVI